MISDNARRESDRGGVKLDLTVNIPTMLSILAMVASCIIYINTQNQAIWNAHLVSTGDIRILQAQQIFTSSDIASLRGDTTSQISQFRTEMKSDLRDLKASVDSLAARR